MKTLESFKSVALSTFNHVSGGEQDTILDGAWPDWIDDGGNFNWIEGGAHFETCPTGSHTFGECAPGQ